ncbi:phage tail protein [Clostridium chromiireducens]|uniref:Phage tail tape measure protein n=1 Tax=Clostridium chromiireducens TaxID=225345 RepID=A0A1V4IUV5_9CLOT|nr:DNA-binding protein [Clostridium chromiireducens]OPJ63683.1 hypothetical protein CLCHR_14980 [Clostridium chromiireducens]
MASKTYEIAFLLGAKMASTFGATFNAAANDIKRLENQGVSASKSFLGLSEGASKIFKVVAGATAAIGIAEVAKKSVELASSLNEVQNVVDTTFRDSSTQIDAWSKTALNSFGLSELQAKQFNGTIGALMKSSGITGDSLVNMSENLSGLSGDFASFFNLPIEESFEKIKSGISGETEPLKSLGINMSVANLQAFALSQGITKSFQSMSQAEQVQLRYNYLMSTTKDVQGDFNKTSESFANQVRIAQTNLSQMAATVAGKVLPYLNNLLLMFNGGSIDKIGTALGGAFDKGISIISSLKPNVDNLLSSIMRFTQISGLDKIWSSFNPGSIFDVIQSGLSNALNGFNEVVSFVINNFSNVKLVLEGVAIGITSYGLALAAVTIQQKGALIIEVLNKAWWVTTGVMGAMREGMTLASIAQLELNAAMAANPIGVITIAIAALIVAGIALYQNWDTISNFFSTVWVKIKSTFVSFWEWLKGFLAEWGPLILTAVAPMLGLPLLIGQHWEQIKGFLSPIWDSIKKSVSNAWQSIKNAVLNAWNSIVNAIVNNPLFKIVSAIFKGVLAIIIVTGYTIYKAFSSIWNSISSSVKSTSNSIGNYLSVVWNKIYSTISSVVSRVWKVIVTTWNSISAAVSIILNSVWNAIVSIWTTIYNSVSAVLKSIWNTIVSIWNSAYNSVSSIVISIWNTIVSGFQSAYNGIVSIFTSIKGTISSIFMDIWNVIKSIINTGIGMINGFIGGVNTVIGMANKVPGVSIETVGTIPQLANGGYIKHRPGGILANIGEGNEDEIVSPVSKLKSIISNSQPQQTVSLSYAPQVIINGNASQDDVYKAISMSQADFDRMMDNYNRKRQRLSFNS